MSFAIDEQFDSKPVQLHESNNKQENGYERQSEQATTISEPSTKEASPASTSCLRFLSLQFYEPYFQVSQDQVIDRLKMSFLPYKTEFFQSVEPNPDLFGPFWILTTIIFLLGSTGNLSRYFYNWEQTKYIFKLQLVRYGVVLVYSFGFGIPTLLYFILKLMKCNTLSLPHLICLYGYSFGCFIVVFLLCILPFPWLHWLLMIYGMINSIAFLIMNLKEYIKELGRKSFVIFGIIGGGQIFLFLMYKLVFFDLIYDNSE